MPAAASASIAPSAESDPRSPSKLPPLGTESMCEPNRIGFSCGTEPSRRAKMLPAGSIRGCRPAAFISPITQRRPSSSASEYAVRLTPSAKVPPAGRPNVLSVSMRCRSAAPSTHGIADCEPRTAGCRLPTADCGLRTAGAVRATSRARRRRSRRRRRSAGSYASKSWLATVGRPSCPSSPSCPSQGCDVPRPAA